MSLIAVKHCPELFRWHWGSVTQQKNMGLKSLRITWIQKQLIIQAQYNPITCICYAMGHAERVTTLPRVDPASTFSVHNIDFMVWISSLSHDVDIYVNDLLIDWSLFVPESLSCVMFASTHRLTSLPAMAETTWYCFVFLSPARVPVSRPCEATASLTIYWQIHGRHGQIPIKFIEIPCNIH